VRDPYRCTVKDLRGVDVIATCSPGIADRVRSYGLKMLTPRRGRIEEAANALSQVVAGRARGGMVIAFGWHP